MGDLFLSASSDMVKHMATGDSIMFLILVGEGANTFILCSELLSLGCEVMVIHSVRTKLVRKDNASKTGFEKKFLVGLFFSSATF